MDDAGHRFLERRADVCGNDGVKRASALTGSRFQAIKRASKWSVCVLLTTSDFIYKLGASSFLKLISAIIKVFQVRQVALTCDLNRLDTVVLSRTREKGDSTTLEIRRCFQQSGKEKVCLRPS